LDATMLSLHIANQNVLEVGSKVDAWASGGGC